MNPARASRRRGAVRVTAPHVWVYKHFADKEKLFAEIGLATTDRVEAMIDLVADIPADADSLEEDLVRLARQFLTALTQPQGLQVRRLIIANANTFPDLGATWHEQGFERVLDTLAGTFQRLATSPPTARWRRRQKLDAVAELLALQMSYERSAMEVGDRTEEVRMA
ncbi:hypothetical protein Sgleb_07610 [Streptomyces glebosus]|uniref:Transcriptional regulator TetR C-terminal Proteobacteria type domain-containing protein n=1 Tax=Streptomyces glebosus TaxID=249580 RepID=A0A640SP84_9ACTN|nr:hypothetical protein Sgleb_07610 [Streptomyces glebosus]GHG75002.1 hypothetical protein GCM10010513_49230 [Streptomyces glebosus]